ncbi:TonB-dependent receptor [Sphingomonas sp. SM33]|uniref:TonB-dependent receptor n=1 Tax=Sphingomonas telluris TaxID=2907998 RepID=A0ABS9VQ21_9SPHN|nr:TonB-dependent receptor [Sphingomonas telluris]MCH8617066.1 TonB-dependent receptor [Sphingomonas telluris]
MTSNLRQRLLASTLLVGASAFGAPAMAQDTTVDPAASQPTGPVEAQPTPSVSSEGEDVQGGQDIIVTGSRIPQPNLESAAPVTVVSDQDVKLSGSTRIEDVLNQLPSVGAAQASGVSNGATGTAEVDLRYLGAKRSLVLVNGRRLMPGDPNSSNLSADLNVIPSAIIKRAEVLTGGASSVYGADAVAGVVNFIMDTNFEGIRFDGNYSIWQHHQDDPSVSGGLHMSDIIGARQAVAGADAFPLPTGSTTDGRSIDGTVTIGAGFDDGRGHVVAYFGYRNTKPVLQGNRDYSACVLQNTGGGVPRCGGSATANPGTGVIFATTTDGAITSTVAALAPGTITPFGGNLYNFAPLNYFQRPDERYIAGAFADYEISPAIKPYLEFMFMDDRTLAQIAPSGDFGNTLTINCDNPFLAGSPFGDPANTGNQYANICGNPNNVINGFLGNFPLATGAPYNPNPGNAPVDFFDARGNTYNQAFFQLLRRNTEGGPRISDLRHQAWRGVLGTRGDLSNVFSYDAYFQYGRTNYTQVYKNEFSIARMNRALNVVNVDANGAVVPIGTDGSQIVCRSVLDGSDPNCVPWDVFGAAPSQAAVNYLNIFGVIQGITSEQIANANVTAQLGEIGWRTPWAEDGVAVNAGVEYRRESLDLNPDQSFQTGDLAGQGAPTLPVSGNFRVWDLFGEAQIPIVQHQGIEDLTLGLGYRKSWYDVSNGRSYDTDTYKISLEFAPISDVRLRGSYNRAVRAPNIQELFGPQFVGLDGSNDPCAKLITATDYGCLAQGLVVGQSPAENPAGQYNGLLGGNPNLSPEKGTTWTIGTVLQPRFIPRFALTVDWWNIKLEDAIQGYGADAVLNACVAQSTATFTAPACGLVQRDPAGSIWLTPGGFVRDVPQNTSTMKNSGIDVNAAYSHPLFNYGKMSWSFIGTYMLKAEVDNGLSAKYDCVGYYGPTCSGGTVAASAPIPQWRHKLRTTWQSPFGLGLSLQWRYVGKVKAETLQDNETVGGEFNFDPGLHVKAQNYFDLSGTFTLLDRVNMRFGVNNLFDNDPPLVTGGNAARGGSNLCPAGPCNGNTYPGTWDALGRLLWVGATIDFLPPKPAPAPAPVPIAPPPPPPPPATQTCPDGSVILATETCPAPPPPPPPPPPAPERG